ASRTWPRNEGRGGCRMAVARNWQNRIVGSGEEAPDQLLANPANWRIHPQAQQDALAGVLSEVGWVQQVIVNQRTGVVDIREHDLRQGVPAEPASLILAVLTLLFTPIEYRQRIVSDAYATLQPGGAFIVVEKILG